MRIRLGSRLLERLAVAVCLGLWGITALAQEPAAAVQSPLSGALWTVAMASASGSAGIPVVTPTATVLALGNPPNDNLATDLFVQNLSPTGTTLWSLPAGLPNNPPSAVAVGDASGNTYLQVQSYATGSTFEARDAAGRLLWGPISAGGYYPWGGIHPVVGFDDSVYFAESNGTGTTVLGVNRKTGATTLKMDFSDVLGLYAYAGGLVVDDFHSHVLYIGYNGAVIHDYPTTLAALAGVSTAGGADGAIFLSGHPGDCSTPINVEKITPAGKSWLKSVAPAGTCTGSILAASPDGGVILAAPDNGSPSSSEVVSLDNAGAIRWRHRFEPTGNPFSQVSLPFVDNTGTVVVPSLFSHVCGTQSCAGLRIEFLNQASGGSVATPIEVSDANTDFFPNGLAIGPGLVYVVRALLPSISALSAPILSEDYRIAVNRPSTPSPPPNPLSLSATPSAQDVGSHVVLLATGAGSPGTLVTFGVVAGPDVGFAAIIAADSTGAAGTTLLGKAVGQDSVVAWLDVNVNGAVDAGESSAQITIAWTNPPPAPIVKYIALGDSYSAGEGVDPYFRDGYDLVTGIQTGAVDNRCHRSSRSYAEYLSPAGASSSYYQMASSPTYAGKGARNLNKYGSDSNIRSSNTAEWDFFACSGAVTANMLPASQGGYPQSETGGFRELGTQLDHIQIDSRTSLVTLTIGGNDIGFADFLETCAFSINCDTPANDAMIRQRAADLSPKLSKIYATIRAKAPNARILVLGYPGLFPATPKEQACGKLVLFTGEQNFLRRMTALLNSTISAAANSSGVTFVDVASSFVGHEVCGSKGEWINGASFTTKVFDPITGKFKKRLDDESFHPNREGQQGYAAAAQKAIG